MVRAAEVAPGKDRGFLKRTRATCRSSLLPPLCRSPRSSNTSDASFAAENARRRACRLVGRRTPDLGMRSRKRPLLISPMTKSPSRFGDESGRGRRSPAGHASTAEKSTLVYHFADFTVSGGRLSGPPPAVLTEEHPDQERVRPKWIPREGAADERDLSAGGDDIPNLFGQTERHV